MDTGPIKNVIFPHTVNGKMTSEPFKDKKTPCSKVSVNFFTFTVTTAHVFQAKKGQVVSLLFSPLH